ncbi:MAG: DNA polymerase III subunit chi [Rhodocyclaceae bacterium]|nr:MAG: DNA polymerase III subunit chi [Rhodocyclaceae bacterium]
MPRVQFLHGTDDRIQAAAAWIAAAWSRRERVTVFAPQRELAERLDRQLWIAPAIGFIPHCRGDSPLAAETPVVITDRILGSETTPSLLNLSDEMPGDMAGFDTLVEIVSTDDAVRLPARDRARQYKEQGCEVQFKDIASGL